MADRVNRPSPEQARQLVADRLRGRARRLNLVRKRVVAVAAAVFVLVWGVIFVQLVTGNDPALAKKTAGAASSSASASSGSSGSTSPGSSASTAASSSAPPASSGGSSSVTTSQS